MAKHTHKYIVSFNRLIQDLRYQDNIFVSLVNNHATIYYHWHDMTLSYYLTYDKFETYVTSDRNNWRDMLLKDMTDSYRKQAIDNINRALEGVYIP